MKCYVSVQVTYLLDNNEFICSKDIYPESIPLTTGCIENDKDTFLDLDITIRKVDLSLKYTTRLMILILK